MLKRRVLLFALGSIALAALAAVPIGIHVERLAERLPSVAVLADPHCPGSTRILSSDGTLLATIETRYRRPAPLSDISPFLIKATVATEDARFFQHGAIDPYGIVRAALADLWGSHMEQGGSTITQQLARDLYLTRTKSLDRKIQEVLLARRIEAAHSKDEILQAYLNTVYYGSGAYGAEAASELYFGTPARSLTLGQASLLAGLPQRPAALSPYAHLAAALWRQSQVLDRMVATGAISAHEKSAALAQPLHLVPARLPSMADWKAPYFVAHVIDLMKRRYSSELLYSGATVVTSLDWRIQRAAEGALAYGLRRWRAPDTGAIVAIEPRTGYVRALVGGPDFQRDQFDAALDGVRQPGSAFKPFVYAAAFDTDSFNLLTTIDDNKTTYRVPPHSWTVRNYDGVYHGQVRLVDALKYSINTVAVQLAAAVGPETVVDYAQRLGITTPLVPDLPLALGASGVHPIDLCSAYTAFANGGPRYEPAFIVEIKGAAGSTIFDDDPANRVQPAAVTDQATAEVNCGLREVVLSGSGRLAASIPGAHGKTGTTSNHRDAWFVGYTGQLAAAVWVACEHHEPHAGYNSVGVRYEPMARDTGGSVCAPMWAWFMRGALPEETRIEHALGLSPTRVPEPHPQVLYAELVQEMKPPDSAAGAESHDELQPAEGAAALQDAPTVASDPPAVDRAQPQRDAAAGDTGGLTIPPAATGGDYPGTSGVAGPASAAAVGPATGAGGPTVEVIFDADGQPVTVRRLGQ